MTTWVVATANLEKRYLVLQNIPIVTCFANRDIEAGEQLGIKYGFRYWRSIQIHPELFEKSGKVMSKRHYKRTSGNLYFNNHEVYTGDLMAVYESVYNNTSIVLKTNQGIKEFSAPIIKQALLAAGTLTLEEYEGYSYIRPKL